MKIVRKKLAAKNVVATRKPGKAPKQKAVSSPKERLVVFCINDEGCEGCGGCGGGVEVGGLEFHEFNTQRDRDRFIARLDREGTIHFDLAPSLKPVALNAFKNGLDKFIGDPTPEAFAEMAVENWKFFSLYDDAITTRMGCFSDMSGSASACKRCDYHLAYKNIKQVCMQLAEVSWKMSDFGADGDSLDFEYWLSCSEFEEGDGVETCPVILMAQTIEVCFSGGYSTAAGGWPKTRGMMARANQKRHRQYLEKIIPMILPNIIYLRSLLENPPSASICKENK